MLWELIDAIILMLIVINPFSKMFYVASLREEFTENEVKYVISRSNIIGLLILVIFAIFGSYILHDIFHIEVDALRVAGGIVLAKIGFDYLEKGAHFVIEKTRNILELSAVPVATPLIAGPAAITTVITVSAEHGLLIGCAASSTAIIINTVLMYISVWITEKIGKTTLSILIRIIGLFIMAIGIQMILIGIRGFI